MEAKEELNISKNEEHPSYETAHKVISTTVKKNFTSMLIIMKFQNHV